MSSSSLVFEFFGEEIPARMHQKAASDLARLFSEKATAAGLSPDGVQSFVTPRRLALVATLRLKQPDKTTERKGPRIDGPHGAISGFLASTGQTLDQLRRLDTPKGSFYLADIVEKGQETRHVLPGLITEIVREFPWPKSMRWNCGGHTWVRPITSGICVFDGKTVPFDVSFGTGDDAMGPVVSFSNVTYGHRFMAPGPIEITSPDQYREALRAAYVILCHTERRAFIAAGAESIAAKKGLSLIPDDGLLDEVTGLVEWPVLHMGTISNDFMNLPPEVLRTSMRVHQRYFSVRQQGSSHIAPYFMVAANIDATDGGAILVQGNERVLRARLSDAAFFYANDLKTPLQDLIPQLHQIVFHEKLGTLGQKVDRLSRLAAFLAPLFGVPEDAAVTAASLCKSDLVTSMVREFPELQGVMGSYYARHHGLSHDVADAISGHYAPRGPGESLPCGPLARLLALCDRLDTLVGFFSAGIRPTGSKDPFALRRTALGIIRLLENAGDAIPMQLFAKSFAGYTDGGLMDPIEDVHTFMLDRLRVYWQGHGMRADIIAAAIDTGGYSDSIPALKKRIESVQDFIKGPRGPDLTAAYARANGIVSIEEKRDGISYDGPINTALLTADSERRLYDTLMETVPLIETCLQRQDFGGAQSQIASLNPFMTAYFQDVIVNDPMAAVRVNRLRLLAMIRKTICQVVNFARIEGVDYTHRG